jgi:hypothetical protein
MCPPVALEQFVVAQEDPEREQPGARRKKKCQLQE